MNREEIKEIYEKYNLAPEDVFKHQHYLIITRTGIEKIQAIEDIKVWYTLEHVEHNFAVVKATAEGKRHKQKVDDTWVSVPITIETFGSALKCQLNETGKNDTRTGNCNTWYVTEMAEKRALSRAVLKITGLYEMGIFGEDESEDFKRGSK